VRAYPIEIEAEPQGERYSSTQVMRLEFEHGIIAGPTIDMRAMADFVG